MTDRLSAALADRYRIERQLGAGGMATVYLATDLRHDRLVALKVLRPELAVVLGAERFLAEIRITARLDHPHILTLIDSGTADEFLYYVLPYVAGESLREWLDREGQLGLTEALTLTRQVASALDYAHGHGVIHRDVKPENIMIHEGEAMLADFGIALAVEDAGAGRLTETGLSLGTPQYMSPEQATADHRIDGRSDIYSLAAVLYEMLAGEPPITGPNARAIFAKLLTERPTPVSAVRDTVPDVVSRAIARGLARTPADRFKSATEMVSALEAGMETQSARPRKHRTAALIAALAAVTLGGAAAWFLLLPALRHRPEGYLLGSKIQLTNSADVLDPSISPDGKQLAYFTQRCDGKGCGYSVVIRDVGASGTHTILENATAEYGLDWSPDRRNLLLTATIGQRWGTWLLSTLGGAPRYLGSGAAAFFAGGDSLLLAPPLARNSDFWIRVASLNGEPRDSIPVADSGTAIGRILAMPGTSWILVELKEARGGKWVVLGRHGAIAGHLISGFNILAGQEADNALWLMLPGESVAKVPIDPATGRFASRWDTLPGPLTAFSVTADGRDIVMDQGTYDYAVWRLAFADLLAGRLPEAQPIARSSTPVQVEISPDGARLRWIRDLPGSGEKLVGITPYDDTIQHQVAISGALLSANWLDSVTLQVGTRRADKRMHLALVDVRTGLESRAFDLPADSDVVDFTAVADGWSWIPASGDRIEVRQKGRTRTFLKPPWLRTVGQLLADPQGRSISYLGWRSELEDSLGLGVLSLADGSNSQWVSMFAENAGTVFLADGSVFMLVFEGQQTVTAYHVNGPGRNERLGTIPRQVWDVSVASNLGHALLTVRDYHADAWMTRVTRR
ncbi:MAG: protein kinase [Gemmatimonadota bacterium]